MRIFIGFILFCLLMGCSQSDQYKEAVMEYIDDGVKDSCPIQEIDGFVLHGCIGENFYLKNTFESRYNLVYVHVKRWNGLSGVDYQETYTSVFEMSSRSKVVYTSPLDKNYRFYIYYDDTLVGFFRPEKEE